MCPASIAKRCPAIRILPKYHISCVEIFDSSKNNKSPDID